MWPCPTCVSSSRATLWGRTDPTLSSLCPPWSPQLLSSRLMLDVRWEPPAPDDPAATDTAGHRDPQVQRHCHSAVVCASPRALSASGTCACGAGQRRPEPRAPKEPGIHAQRPCPQLLAGHLRPRAATGNGQRGGKPLALSYIGSSGRGRTRVLCTFSHTHLQTSALTPNLPFLGNCPTSHHGPMSLPGSFESPSRGLEWGALRESQLNLQL